MIHRRVSSISIIGQSNSGTSIAAFRGVEGFVGDAMVVVELVCVPGSRSSVKFLPPPTYMADDDREVARLWRINRTIHELVQDRVRLHTIAASTVRC